MGISCHSADVLQSCPANQACPGKSCTAGFSGSEIWIIWTQFFVSCLFGLLCVVCEASVVCDLVCGLIGWVVRNHHIHSHYDASSSNSSCMFTILMQAQLSEPHPTLNQHKLVDLRFCSNTHRLEATQVMQIFLSR